MIDTMNLLHKERKLFQEELEKKGAPTTTSTSIAPSSTSLTTPIKNLIANYDSLNDATKKALLWVALSSNNYELQRELFSKNGLVTNNNMSKQAKLAKELIKLANTYNAPKLKFSEQATKHRTAAWVTKLKTILSMFPATTTLIDQDTIVPFPDPNCYQNNVKADLASGKPLTSSQNVKNAPWDAKDIICFKCGEPGHKSPDCPKGIKGETANIASGNNNKKSSE